MRETGEPAAKGACGRHFPAGACGVKFAAGMRIGNFENCHETEIEYRPHSCYAIYQNTGELGWTAGFAGICISGFITNHQNHFDPQTGEKP